MVPVETAETEVSIAIYVAITLLYIQIPPQKSWKSTFHMFLFTTSIQYLIE